MVIEPSYCVKMNPFVVVSMDNFALIRVLVFKLLDNSAMTYEELAALLEGCYLKHLKNLSHLDLQEAMAPLTEVGGRPSKQHSYTCRCGCLQHAPVM